MKVEVATVKDADYLTKHDHHISEKMLERKLEAGEILVAKDNDVITGYLRYGYFWDGIPFMNLIFVEGTYRQKGVGKHLFLYWEEVMRNEGHDMLMTSSYSHERGQFFHRRMGFQDAGSLILPNEPLEIIFIKTL
jgi:GNAT superfamily N-acetyltransferase